jgi:hypothetical protein
LLTGGRDALPPSEEGGVIFDWVEVELVRRKKGIPEGVRRLFVGGGFVAVDAGPAEAGGASPTGVMDVTDRFSILLAVALELSDPACAEASPLRCPYSEVADDAND